eukprot:5079908-Karenia_brevis.AAC.1
MLDASRILAHLSQAQQFVLQLHSGSLQCPAAVVFAMLQRIDEVLDQVQRLARAAMVRAGQRARLRAL